jgi:hypothetical protein
MLGLVRMLIPLFCANVCGTARPKSAAATAIDRADRKRRAFRMKSPFLLPVSVI